MNHIFTVRILNLKFSPNVGDGVVAECLETLLKKNIPDVDVGTDDLSARDSFGASGSVGGKWVFNELMIEPINGRSFDRLVKGSEKVKQFFPDSLIVSSIKVWKEKD